MENQPATKKKVHVGLFLGHKHASHPSISNDIGTSRIAILKSVILKGPNDILTCYRVGISRNTEKRKKSKQKVDLNFENLSYHKCPG